MSWLKCAGCERIVNSDADPDGWVAVGPWKHGYDNYEYFCRDCREREINDGWEEIYAQEGRSE